MLQALYKILCLASPSWWQFCWLHHIFSIFWAKNPEMTSRDQIFTKLSQNISFLTFGQIWSHLHMFSKSYGHLLFFTFNMGYLKISSHLPPPPPPPTPPQKIFFRKVVKLNLSHWYIGTGLQPASIFQSFIFFALLNRVKDNYNFHSLRKLIFIFQSHIRGQFNIFPPNSTLILLSIPGADLRGGIYMQASHSKIGSI